MATRLFDARSRPREDEIRERITAEFDGTILISRGSANTKRCVHPPGDDDEPLCRQPLWAAEWYPTSLSVYPPGHITWCNQCLARLFPERANVTVEVFE